MNQRSTSFVPNYWRSNVYSLNVIVGALESALPSDRVEILIPHKPRDVASTIQSALDRKRKVVVGWSLPSAHFGQGVDELNDLKQRLASEDVIHLAGGPHPTAEPEQTLRAGFDAVVRGEGEDVIIEFMECLVNAEDYLDSDGIAYLSNGRLVSNGFGARIDLNNYPPFAPMQRRFNPIEITRGCVYACKFCQTPFMFKARFRHRSVENICHYVEVMRECGLRDIRFISPTALSYGSNDRSVNLAKVEELLSSVRAVLGQQGRIFFGTFPSEIRPEHVSHEAMEVLKKYVNNDNLVIGGQSGSQRVLDTSRRDHSVEDIIYAVQICLDAGFVPNVDFVFGLPGETASDIQTSLEIMEHLGDLGARIHGHTFMPLPGTPFKNALPGNVDRRTMRLLGRLAAQGKLYGEWKKQISIAKNLAKMATGWGSVDETQTTRFS